MDYDELDYYHGNPYLDNDLIAETNDSMGHNRGYAIPHNHQSAFGAPQPYQQQQYPQQYQQETHYYPNQPQAQVPPPPQQNYHTQEPMPSNSETNLTALMQSISLNKNAIEFIPSSQPHPEMAEFGTESNVNAAQTHAQHIKLLQSVGIPFDYDPAGPTPSPLQRSDFASNSVKRGDRLLITCIDEGGNHCWSFNTFEYTDHRDNEMFVYNSRNKMEKFDLDELPLMLLWPKKNAAQQQSRSHAPEPEESHAQQASKSGVTRTKLSYGDICGQSVFIETQRGRTKYTIKSYEAETSWARLVAINGDEWDVRLDGCEHEIVDPSQEFSRRLEIRKPTQQELDEHNRTKGFKRFPPAPVRMAASGAESNKMAAIGPNGRNGANLSKNVTFTQNVHNLAQMGNKTNYTNYTDARADLLPLPKVWDAEVRDAWNHGKLDKVLKDSMCWKYNKNSFLASLTLATSDTRYTNLDYRNLMFISGFGLSFNWIDCDYESSDSSQDEILKYLSNESDHFDILTRIGRHTGYKLFQVSPAIASDPTQVQPGQNINDLENMLIRSLSSGLGQLTHDKDGHIGVIVGYCEKPAKYIINSAGASKSTQSRLETKYLFKLKKMVAFEKDEQSALNEVGRNEYLDGREFEVIDLARQKFVILAFNPAADRPNHLVDKMSVKVVYDGLNEFVNLFENGSENTVVDEENGIVFGSDLSGKKAIEQYVESIEDMLECVETNNWSEYDDKYDMQLVRNIIYTLIKFLDGRKAMYQFFDRINGLDVHIDQMKGIYQFVSDIKRSLKMETNLIENNQSIGFFKNYIENYDGRPLRQKIWEWENLQTKREVLNVFANIMKHEIDIIENCKKLATVFAQHL